MTLTSLGRINQPTPGTPIALSTDPTKRVAKIFFQVPPGLTGKTYIGMSGMNKTSLSGVLRVLSPAQVSTFYDQFFLETSDGNDSIYLTQYLVDSDNAGEGLLVSYWAE